MEVEGSRPNLPHSSKGRAKGGLNFHTVSDPGRQLCQDRRASVPLIQEHNAGKVSLVPNGPAWVDIGFSIKPTSKLHLRQVASLPQPSNVWQVTLPSNRPSALAAAGGLPMDWLTAFMHRFSTSIFPGRA